jgi:hypothetical protein
MDMLFTESIANYYTANLLLARSASCADTISQRVIERRDFPPGCAGEGGGFQGSGENETLEENSIRTLRGCDCRSDLRSYADPQRLQRHG